MALREKCVKNSQFKNKKRNNSHTLAYSLVGLQEMNLCFKYPIIYWDCACLITNSGGTEAGTDYDKVAVAINKAKKAGTTIKLPNINKSDFGFKPDIKNNQIICGLKSLVNIGDDLVNEIIEKRSYENVEDFYNKVKPNKQAMISLIKAGSFDEMEDRTKVMTWFISLNCGLKKRITLQNMKSIIEYNILPNEEHYKNAIRFYEFNRYLKALDKQKNKTYFVLDERAINFLEEVELDDLILSDTENSKFYINKNEWDKRIYQKQMDIIRNWLQIHQIEALKAINDNIFIESWDKDAVGNLSSWEMDSLCFYYHEHELANIDKEKFGIQEFESLPMQPVIERTYKRGDYTINLFKINKICGTVIAKDKSHGTFSLLTASGEVVPVRLGKERFALYDKQISVINPDGSKSVIEKSWLQRGSKLIIQGIRSDNEFVAKKYASTGGHTLYKILEVKEDGDLILQGERKQGD